MPLPLLPPGGGAAPGPPAAPPGPLGAMSCWIAWDANPLSLGIIAGNDSTMEGANNWVGDTGATLTFSIAQPHSGTQSLALTRTSTTGTAGCFTSVRYPVVGSRWYILRVNVATLGGARPVSLDVDWYNGGGSYLSSSFTTVTESPFGYTEIILVAQAPATATTLLPILAVAGVPAGEYHLIDTVTCDYLGTDESGRLLAATPQPARGRNDELDTPQASGYTLVLGNRDGKLTPGAATPGAPYTGNVLPRRKVVLLGAVAGQYYSVWAGYTTGYPQSIAVSWSQVSVSCIDGFTWLSGYDVDPPYRQEIVSFDAPSLYLPCNEPAGASAAGNIVGGGSAPVVSSKYGGHYAFGQTSVLAVNSSGHTADNDGTSLGLNFSLAGQQGSCLDLTALPGSGPVPGQPFTAELWFSIPAAPAAESMLYRASAGGFPDLPVMQVAMIAGGQLVVTTGPEGAVVTTTFGYFGTSRHVVLKYDPSVGSFGRLTLVSDNAETINYTLAADMFMGAAVGLVQVGGICRPTNRAMQSGFPGNIGHVACYPSLLSSTRITVHNILGHFGGFTETEGNRVGGIINLAMWPVADTRVDVGLTTLLGRAWGPTNALAQVQETARQGAAAVIMDAAGKIQMLNRQRRIDRPVRFTFKASTATDAEDSDFTPKLDETNIENVVQADSAIGGQVVLTDSTSIGKYGRKKGAALSLAIANQAEVTSAVQARLLQYKDPQVRVDTVSFRPDASQTVLLFQQVLALEFGDRITLAELPTLAPASSADYFVERIGHTWVHNTWTVQLGLSPVSSTPGVNTGLRLDDPIFGALDSWALTY